MQTQLARLRRVYPSTRPSAQFAVLGADRDRENAPLSVETPNLSAQEAAASVETLQTAHELSAMLTVRVVGGDGCVIPVYATTAPFPSPGAQSS